MCGPDTGPQTTIARAMLSAKNVAFQSGWDRFADGFNRNLRETVAETYGQQTTKTFFFGSGRSKESSRCTPVYEKDISYPSSQVRQL